MTYARDIADQLHEAIRTLAALPDRERRYLNNRVTAWPEPLREIGEVFAVAVEAGGRHEDMRARRDPPSPEAIDRMLPCLMWLRWLDRRQRQVVTGRAHRIAWWKLGAKAGRSEQTMQRWHAEAISIVERQLVAEPERAIA